jgi:uncharacterized protein
MRTSEQRYISLDAMRGFAVMGILAMNIISFAMPEWAYITPAAYGGDSLADQIAWFFAFIFIDGKMRGLFSLLFGASLMLVIDRATDKGESAAQVHYRRMAWLAVFGLAHYFFIWFGDILFLYAVVGMVAFCFRDWPPVKLIKTAFAIFAIGMLLWGVQFVGLQYWQYLATQPSAGAEMARTYREMMADPSFDLNPAPEIALYHGSYGQIVADKFNDWAAPIMTLLQSICETLPLMMVGMAMNKSGFITGGWDAAYYRRLAVLLVPLGLLLTGGLAAWMIMARFDRVTALAIFFFRSCGLFLLGCNSAHYVDRRLCGCAHPHRSAVSKSPDARPYCSNGARGIQQLSGDEHCHDNHFLWLWLWLVWACGPCRIMGVCAGRVGSDVALVKAMADEIPLRPA